MWMLNNIIHESQIIVEARNKDLPYSSVLPIPASLLAGKKKDEVGHSWSGYPAPEKKEENKYLKNFRPDDRVWEMNTTAPLLFYKQKRTLMLIGFDVKSAFTLSCRETLCIKVSYVFRQLFPICYLCFTALKFRLLWCKYFRVLVFFSS